MLGHQVEDSGVIESYVECQPTDRELEKACMSKARRASRSRLRVPNYLREPNAPTEQSCQSVAKDNSIEAKDDQDWAESEDEL